MKILDRELVEAAYEAPIDRGEDQMIVCTLFTTTEMEYMHGWKVLPLRMLIMKTGLVKIDHKREKWGKKIHVLQDDPKLQNIN